MSQYNKDFVSKDLAWKGLNMELRIEGVIEIMQQDIEKDDYYNFNILLKGIKKALNKEIDFKYYTYWCILVSNCLDRVDNKDPIACLLYEVSWFFDGCSFDDEWNRKKLLYEIAVLKNFNHEMENLINNKKEPFETNGVERILVFDHANCGADSKVMRLIVKDNKNKQFDLRYIDENDFDYDEEINYTFVESDEFDDIFQLFYEEENWIENHKIKF